MTKAQLIGKSQAQHIREVSYQDGMKYRELALKTGSKDHAMFAILNFRIWIRAAVIDLIETKQLASGTVKPIKQLK
jgi:hypothetical protein